MRARPALLAALALLAFGCSQRERSNPFDPQNPTTSGRPPGFVALAGDREVQLRWAVVPNGSFIGYQVYRRAPGDPGFQAITDVLGTSNNAFRDLPLVNGLDYQYRLYFVFSSGLGSTPSEQVASPGAARPWLIESGGDGLIRVTPDNRHVAQRRSGFGATNDVAANPASGDVWVSDGSGGRVIVYENGVTLIVSGFSTPRAIAVDATDATAWVCDTGRGRVYHLNRNGQFDTFSLGPLDQPVDAAVDAGSGYLWVCELGANRVTRWDQAVMDWSATVSGASRVAVDSVTAEGWVTSYGGGTVSRLSPLGQVLDTYHGFTAPLGVAVDSRRGRIWIADPYAGRVTALARDGQELFHVSGLNDAGELSVDLVTGDVWAVLGATGAVVHISSAGAVLQVQGGFQFPYAISVDPGGH